MTDVRLFVRLNKGRIGIPLRKLAAVSQELERFVRSAAEDAGVEAPADRWIADGFENGSVAFAVEFHATHEEDATRYRRTLNDAITFRGDRKLRLATARTARQYARIAEHLDEDEEADFSFKPFYGAPVQTPALPELDEQLLLAVAPISLSPKVARAISEAVEDTVEYQGSVRGVIHALYKESSPAYFNLRELVSQTIVKCVFPPNLYAEVVRLLKDRQAVVHVGGLVSAARIDRTIQEVRVERLEKGPDLPPGGLDRVIGSMPDFTGAESAAAAIGKGRRDRG